MAIVIKQWCTWDSDTGKVSYTYDDTVSAGFPFGKLTGLSWVNNSQNQQIITVTLTPGTTASDLAPGQHGSIPLAAGALTPTPNGVPVEVGDLAGTLVTFTSSAQEVVGATALAVASQVTVTDLPVSSNVYVPLPSVTIPPSGQTASLPAFYGGGTVNSTGSVSLASLGIPMIQETTPHGTFVAVPANLSCAGN